MGKTTEVTAQSRNSGSLLERTLGSSRGWATPESYCRDWTSSWEKRGGPGGVPAWEACEMAEASGRRLEGRARLRAAAADPGVGLGGQVVSRGRVYGLDGALLEGEDSIPGGWAPTPIGRLNGGRQAQLGLETLTCGLRPCSGGPPARNTDAPGAGSWGRPTRRLGLAARFPKRPRRHRSQPAPPRPPLSGTHRRGLRTPGPGPRSMASG